MGDKIKLSVCMMVKNEEEMLPRCLKSIQGIADELIIVDTGSEDRTVEIAESFGAKVYHHPWENDFSKHRNQSISYATGDWILQIDADEELNLENFSVNKMKKVLARLPEELQAVLVTISDYNQQGDLMVSFKYPRLYRNKVGVHYKGRVHNQLVYQGQVKDSDMELFHYGYDLETEKMDAKFHRTTTLLKKRIEENSKDYDAYFYLANSYAKEGKLNDSIEYAKDCFRYLEESENESALYLSNYYTLGSCYFKLKDWKKSRYWCEKGLQKNNDDIGLIYVLIMTAIAEKKYDEALILIKRYFKSYKVIQENPLLMQGQFIYHGSDDSYNRVKYLALSVNLYQNNYEKFEQQWENIKEKIYSNPKWQKEILNNISTKNKIELLIDKSLELIENCPNKANVLIKPLIKSVSQNDGSDLVQTFTNRLRDYHLSEKSVEILFREFYRIDEYKICRLFLEKFEVMNITQPEFLSYILYVFHKEKWEDKGKNTCKVIMSRKNITADLLEPVIRYYYEIGDEDGLGKSLTNYFQILINYKSVDSDILLIAGKYLVKNGQIELLLMIAEALSMKVPLEFDNTIDSIESLSEYFASIGEKFSSNERYDLMQIALEIAFDLSGNFKHLEKIADSMMAVGQYQNSVKFYNKLVQSGYNNYKFAPNMKRAFMAMEDYSGVELCEKLISVPSEV